MFAVISLGAIFHFRESSNQQITVRKATQPLENDVLPGGNKATLTLADGTLVVLDETKDGEIADISGIRISKNKDDQIVYEISDANPSSKGAATKYNQISTPRGGQYQIILPDGTKVWLNAASSLKYPVQFTGKSRIVELTGEAYFEVNSQLLKNGKKLPFIVKSLSQTIEVLGTHFNVNSYDDEDAIKTTLLEGIVRVFANSNQNKELENLNEIDQNKGIILNPNQQSVLKRGRINVVKVDAEESVAWKKGYFSFKNADLSNVMRQLSRWYDVDVFYEGEIPSGTYSGKVYRNMNISKVFEILAYTELNFRVEGKKIIIFSNDKI